MNRAEATWVNEERNQALAVPSQSPTRLSVLALNLYNPTETGRVERIIAFMKGVGPDLIILTECRLPAFRAIAEALGCVGVWSHAPYWGNGLLSLRCPIDSARGIDLVPDGRSEMRSAIVADVRVGPSLSLPVVGTHLEVQSEEKRLEQLELLSTEVDLKRAILAGDFNALRESDYDEEGLAQLQRARRSARLQPASWELTERLINAMSMRDAADAGGHPPGRATCRYGTRVDYILFGSAALARPVANSYRVLECIDEGLTDHNAVFVHVEVALDSRSR